VAEQRTDYQRGYGAGRRYSERQIEALHAQVGVLKEGIRVLAEMLNEAEEPMTVYRPCERHAGLPITFTGYATPAVPVCPHCQKEVAPGVPEAFSPSAGEPS
jgi:hypothetical protein